jgi:hypothetical protein
MKAFAVAGAIAGNAGWLIAARAVRSAMDNIRAIAKRRLWPLLARLGRAGTAH